MENKKKRQIVLKEIDGKGNKEWLDEDGGEPDSVKVLCTCGVNETHEMIIECNCAKSTKIGDNYRSHMKRCALVRIRNVVFARNKFAGPHYVTARGYRIHPNSIKSLEKARKEGRNFPFKKGESGFSGRKKVTYDSIKKALQLKLKEVESGKSVAENVIDDFMEIVETIGKKATKEIKAHKDKTYYVDIFSRLLEQTSKMAGEQQKVADINVKNGQSDLDENIQRMNDRELLKEFMKRFGRQMDEIKGDQNKLENGK